MRTSSLLVLLFIFSSLVDARAPTGDECRRAEMSFTSYMISRARWCEPEDKCSPSEGFRVNWLDGYHLKGCDENPKKRCPPPRWLYQCFSSVSLYWGLHQDVGNKIEAGMTGATKYPSKNYDNTPFIIKDPGCKGKATMIFSWRKNGTRWPNDDYYYGSVKLTPRSIAVRECPKTTTTTTTTTPSPLLEAGKRYVWMFLGIGLVLLVGVAILIWRCCAARRKKMMKEKRAKENKMKKEDTVDDEITETAAAEAEEVAVDDEETEKTEDKEEKSKAEKDKEAAPKSQETKIVDDVEVEEEHDEAVSPAPPAQQPAPVEPRNNQRPGDDGGVSPRYVDEYEAQGYGPNHRRSYPPHQQNQGQGYPSHQQSQGQGYPPQPQHQNVGGYDQRQGPSYSQQQQYSGGGHGPGPRQQQPGGYGQQQPQYNDRGYDQQQRGYNRGYGQPQQQQGYGQQQQQGYGGRGGRDHYQQCSSVLSIKEFIITTETIKSTIYIYEEDNQ